MNMLLESEFEFEHENFVMQWTLYLYNVTIAKVYVLGPTI